ALGRRLAFLVEHLTSREETNALQRRAEKNRQRADIAVQKVYELTEQLNFLHMVRKTLDLVSSMDDVASNDVCNALGSATQSFSSAVGASVAALYLWDEDQQ